MQQQTYCFTLPPDPALPPPKGMIPNFQNAYTLQPYHTLTASLAILMTTTFVALRLYTKRYIMKAVMWEDYACAIGWILYVAFIALEFRVVGEKGGTHQWDITYKEYELQLKYSNYLDILYAPTISLIKLSILLLVTRLFCPRPFPSLATATFHHLILALNILNTIFYTIHFFLPIFVCTPRKKIWDPRMPGKCLDVFSLYIASAAINVGSDVAMFFVPLYRIWTLKISKKRRMGVSAVFAVGGLAVVSSVMRLIWGFELAKTEDYSYVKVETVLWVYGELGFGIVCSCCPIMPRLWREVTAPEVREISGVEVFRSKREGKRSYGGMGMGMGARRPGMGRSATAPVGTTARVNGYGGRRTYVPVMEAARRGPLGNGRRGGGGVDVDKPLPLIARTW